MRKITEHLKKHKTVYIVGSVALGAGLAVGFGAGRMTKAAQAVNTVIVGSNNTVHNEIIQSLVRRGHPGYVLRCVETGESFASINRAAKVLEVSPTSIRNHLKGLSDTAKGFTFECLGEAVA